MNQKDLFLPADLCWPTYPSIDKPPQKLFYSGRLRNLDAFWKMAEDCIYIIDTASIIQASLIRVYLF